MSSSLIIILLQNVWLGYNLSLIELYAHLSMRFVLYNVSDLMCHEFYTQVINAVMPFILESFFFPSFSKEDFSAQEGSCNSNIHIYKLGRTPLSLSLVIRLVI